MLSSRAPAVRRVVLAVVLVLASVAGYAGAAAFTALALPPVQVATDFGPGDGLSRYVLTADAGVATGDLVHAVGSATGVVTAQALDDGRALVATEGLAPHHLDALPGVARVEVSPSVPVLGTVSDPYWSAYGWNLENTGRNAYAQAGTPDADVDAPDGWEGGTGGGMVVAVVDTGFDSDHPDLAGSLWTNPAEPCGPVDRDRNGKAGDCHGWNFVTNSADVDNGPAGTHGASVAGVIGARAGNGHGTAGVAPDVQLMPLVIGSGETVDVTLGAQAIRYAADHGAHVVNASWGGAFTGSALTGLQAAIDYARSRGVVVVAAAGNDAANRDTTPLYPASLTNSNLITVGSHTAADTVSASSAHGVASVDLFGPGNLVFTTWNDGGYRLVSGTSLAAPQVAAAVAMYRAHLPDATADELKAALLSDVEPVAAYTGRSVTGGRLSVAALAGGGVDHRFTGMTAPAGLVTPTITATGAGGPGSYAVRVGLGMELAGEIYALADEAVSVDGTTVVTDDSGEVLVPLGPRSALGTISVSPSVELGDGRYVLTAQVLRDGRPAAAAHAAPLLVGTAATPPTDSDGPGDGGAGDGSTPDGEGDDGAGGPGAGPGGTGPDGAGPGPGDEDGSGDGTESPDGTDAPDGTESPEGAESPDGGPTPDGAESPDGGPTPDGAQPPDGGPTPDGAETPDDIDSPDGSGGAGGPRAPDGPGGTPAPGEDGVGTYPGTGPFRITSISPTWVDTTGGTVVTITGRALPTDPRVRVGATGVTTVLRASATEVAFRIPPRVAGTYDVSVFATDGTQDVLPSALIYVEQPAPPAVGDGGAPGTPAPGTPAPGTPAPGTPAPGVPAPGSPAPALPPVAPPPGDGDGGSGPVVGTGPGGERLVRTAKFAGLPASFWAMDCSVSCRGVPL